MYDLRLEFVDVYVESSPVDDVVCRVVSALAMLKDVIATSSYVTYSVVSELRHEAKSATAANSSARGQKNLLINTYFLNSGANLRTIPEKSATFIRILS